MCACLCVREREGVIETNLKTACERKRERAVRKKDCPSNEWRLYFSNLLLFLPNENGKKMNNARYELFSLKC